MAEESAVMDAVDTGASGGADTSSEYSGTGMPRTGDVSGRSGNEGANDRNRTSSTRADEVGVDETRGAPENDEGSPEDVSDPDYASGIPKQYKKDKFVKAIFHENRRLKEAFPGGVNEALQIKQTLDAVGGIDQITEFRERALGAAQIDKDFAEGNPAVLEDFIAESPTGFAKLIGPALDKLATVDPQAYSAAVSAGIDKLFDVNPEAYNYSLSRAFWATLNNGPTSPVAHLQALQAALKAGNTEEASARLDAVGKFLDSIYGMSQQVPKAPEKKVDPERAKFEEEKSAWQKEREKEQQEKRQTYVKNFDGDVNKYGISKLEAALAKEFSTRKRDFAAFKQQDKYGFDLLMRNCFNELQSKVRADEGSVKRGQGLLLSGKRDDAMKVMQSSIDQKFTDAVARTYKAFYSVGGGGSTAGAAAKAVVNGASDGNGSVAAGRDGMIMLSRRPLDDQVDKSRMLREFGPDTTSKMLYNSQAYLKGKPGRYRWA